MTLVQPPMRMCWRVVESALLMALVAGPCRAQAQAQGPAPTPTTASRVAAIQVDRGSAAIGGVLPFDEPFQLKGNAPATLLRVDLWWKDSASYSRKDCLRGDTTTAHSEWERVGPGEEFSLNVGALEPNKMYTFCLRSLERLSGTDSSRFVARATAAVRKRLMQKVWIPTGTIDSVDSLRKLQQMLHDALPPLAVVPPGSVLRAPDPSDNAQHTIDTAVFSLFIGFAQLRDARIGAAAAVDTESFTRRPDHLGWLIDSVSKSRGLARLAGVDRALAPASKSILPLPKETEDRFAAAASLARRWMLLPGVPTLAQAVAYGTTSIQDLRYPTSGNANPVDVFDKATVAEWSRNMDVTIDAIVALRELAAFTAADPGVKESWNALPDSGKAAAGDVAALRTLLYDTYIAANRQRTNLRLFSESLTAIDSGIDRLTTEIVGRELKHVGLSSTTAANYEARARWYVGQDLGIVFGRRGRNAREASPYLGLNIYLRPVNKRAPRQPNCFWRCTSVSLGVTTSNWTDTNRYTGILAGKPLVVGVGYRIGDFLRVGYASSLVYSYRYLDTGKSQRRLDALWGGTISLDYDLREVVGNLATALGFSK